MSNLPCLLNDATIQITRFDVAYPSDQPTSYVVGFTVRCNHNGKHTYTDAVIPYTEVEGKTDQEIAEVAWNRLKASLQNWLDSIYGFSPMVGSFFTPPAPEEPAPEEPAPEEPTP